MPSRKSEHTNPYDLLANTLREANEPYLEMLRDELKHLNQEEKTVRPHEQGIEK